MALTASNMATCIIASPRVNGALGSCFSEPIATPLAPHSATTSAAAVLGAPMTAAIPMHRMNAVVSRRLSMIFLRDWLAPVLLTVDFERGHHGCLEGTVTGNSGFH